MPSTYHIELRGFPGITRDEAAARLARRFDLDREKANRFVNKAPCVVRSGVNAKAAKSYALELMAIGADVRIVDEVSGSGQAYRALDLEKITSQTNGNRNGLRNQQSKAPDEEEDPFIMGVQRAGATLFCPRCGHHQSSVERCANCGHWVSAEYPSVTTDDREVEEEPDLNADSTSDDVENVDVFASLNGADDNQDDVSLSAGRLTLSSLPKLSKRKQRRRRAYDPFAVQYHRWYLVALLLLFLATALVLLMSPD